MIKKYVKKPLEVEAIQVKEENIKDIEVFFGGKLHQVDQYGCITTVYSEFDFGVDRAGDGDWIIKGVNGEFYPCTDEVFRKTYEEA